MQVNNIIKILKILYCDWYYQLKKTDLIKCVLEVIKSKDPYSEYGVSKIESDIQQINESEMDTNFIKEIDNSILYIKIKDFNEKFINTIKEFTISNSRIIVIDVRGCRGGKFEGAVYLANKILYKTTFIFKTKKDEKEVDIGESHLDIPIYCLINERTASSAEFIAGLVKESRNGKIIGDGFTFGKNTIQRFYSINGISFKITVGKFLFKELGDIQYKGIVPDIVMDSYIDNSFERLRLGREIHIGDKGTNIYVLQKILKQLLNDEVNIDEVCTENTMNSVSKLLNKVEENVISIDDLYQINKMYMEFCTRIENDAYMQYIINKTRC